MVFRQRVVELVGWEREMMMIDFATTVAGVDFGSSPLLKRARA